MGVVSTAALFSFICFVLMYKTDGNSMSLSSSSATSGQPVTLRCEYIGSYTPVTINFYNETDILGLQIDLSSCSFASSTGYDTTLYDKNCGVKAVNLTIKSVTAYDIGKTWQCDATFLPSSSPPVLPAKASITIHAPSTPGNSSSPAAALNTTEIAGIVTGVGAVVVHGVLIVVIIFYWHDLGKKARLGIIIVSVIFVAVEVLIIYLIIKYCCNKKCGSSQSGDETNRIGNSEQKMMSSSQSGDETNRIGNSEQKMMSMQKPVLNPSENHTLPNRRLPPLLNRNVHVLDSGHQNL